MQGLVNDSKEFKIRVYLITAQNLSAMSSVIDFKSRMAGMTAMCTANPYPVIQVGDNVPDKGRANLVKMIQDKDSVKTGDLSPEFLKIYELDAIMPEDWKLTISIMDNQAYSDELIG
jgi:hypothetical protein